MILYMLTLAPILMGIFLYLLHLKAYKKFMIVGQSGLFVASLYLFLRIDVLHEGILVHSLSQYPSSIGINLMADSISAFFLVLTCFIFLSMFIYAYDKSFMNPLFICLFFILEGLIITAFLVQDLFSLYAIIEVSTIVVSLLVMYKKDATTLYDGMLYLMTNIISMTFFLLGVGYVYKIFGTLDITTLAGLVKDLDHPNMVILPYAFLMTAIGLKSAVMPLFSRLPHAHVSPSAPYIVSAVLSGLHVKGNLYIFIRLQSIFGDTLDTYGLFLFIGFITAIIAMLLSLAQKDLKLLLAYSTVSQMGFIIFGLSINTDYSYYGSIYHIINHAIFKSLLFLCVGLIIDNYHTRDMNNIHGVFKSMPYVSIVMLLSLLGITGAPLFNGSVSKYLIQSGSGESSLLEYGILFLNLGTMLYAIKLSTIFFGPKIKISRPPIHQSFIIGLLGLICVIGGAFGHYFVGLFFDISIQWLFIDYIEKLLIYALSGTLAIILYKYIVKPSKRLSKLRQLELTFNELVFCIVTFFSGLLTYLMVITP